MNGSKSNKEMTLKEIKNNLRDYIVEEPFGTNTGEALYEALKFRDCDVVYFLTDGHPSVGETNIQNILSRVRYNNQHKAVINSVMVGLPGITFNKNLKVMFDPNSNPKE